MPRGGASNLAGLAGGRAAAAPAFTATEMMKLKRLADPQLAPDGGAVAYALTEIDLAGATRNADIWLAPLTGGEPRRLTSDKASDTRPRFSPDGKSLAFLSTRDGSSQVWRLELVTERQAFCAIRADVDVISTSLERLTKELANRGLVFHEKNARLLRRADDDVVHDLF